MLRACKRSEVPHWICHAGGFSSGEQRRGSHRHCGELLGSPQRESVIRQAVSGVPRGLRVSSVMGRKVDADGVVAWRQARQLHAGNGEESSGGCGWADC